MQEGATQPLIRVAYRPKDWYWTREGQPGEHGPYNKLDDCFRSAVPEGEQRLVKLPGGCVRRITMKGGRAQMATA